MKVLLFI